MDIKNERGKVKQVKRRKLICYGVYTSLGRRIVWRRTWLKDAHQDTEQGSSKKTLERRYQRVDGAIHQRGSKICRGQKTVEGRYGGWHWTTTTTLTGHTTTPWAIKTCHFVFG